ncbi:MAG: TolB family protein [Byssovorax sp.]
MRHLGSPASLAAAVLLAGLIPVACGGAGGSGGTSGSTAHGGAGGTGSHSGTGTATATGVGGCDFNCSGGGSVPGVLAVSCDTFTIDVLNGSSTPAHCSATVGGSKVGASWVVDVSAVAGVDAAGTVSATGKQGGDVVVKATYNNQSAAASVKVTLKKVLNPGGVSDPDKAVLTGAVNPDAASVVWAYPYNATVFPKGLLAPEMMWNGGGAGDKYYVHVKGKYVDFEFFTMADPPSRYSLDDASWEQLTESGPGGDIALHVARMPAGAQTAAVVVDHTWKIANGSLRGTVYYWSNNLGRVVRIKPGAKAPDDFLKNDVGLDSYAAENKCTTCHAVSANGSTLVMGGDYPATTIDLLTNKVVYSIVPPSSPPDIAALRRWSMPALSPNGKVLIQNNAKAIPGPPGGQDGMWDTTTGQKIVGTGLDGVLLGMPAFAPNGTKIAYVGIADAQNVPQGLNVYDYDVNTNQVQNAVGLVPAGADQGLNAIAFPSVSPDAKWITYHRGHYPDSLDTRFGPGDLYVASVDQPGVEMRLGKANGDGYPFAAGARDLSYNYEPTFAPLNSGGFAWVVFTSRRTLGNQLTGAKDVVKQLWVAAIDQNPQPGQDPSHPAFWVKGQDIATLNMRGFWALDPCKEVGGACGTGSECCNQNCDTGVCKVPDPNTCSMSGNHCEKSADCCDPKASCINNICSEPPPQ